jgi:predicted site-specific integrase-resolvase
MKFITAREAARQMGLNHQTICNWFRLGKFPNAFEVEGNIRIPISDVEALKTQPFKQAEGA